MDKVAGRHAWRVFVAMAMAAAALVVGATGEARAGGVPCQRTFTNATAAAISPFTFTMMPPDFIIPMPVPGFGASAIDVPGSTVADVDVTVNITHPSADLLGLSVQHGSTAIALKNLGGTSGANMTGTTFDDEGAQNIGSGAPPYSGRFRPVSALTAFDGSAAAGTWSLAVSNPVSPSPGTIDSWSVTITYAGSCDLDSDAVEDHADGCLGVSAHTATGCPLTTRSLSAKYKLGKFKGVLSSPVVGCQASRAVTIWKVRSGADKLVGTATTSSAGSYKLKRAKHLGRYYATSPRVAVTDVAECPAATSPTFRMR
jgi:hypothetical protein